MECDKNIQAFLHNKEIHRALLVYENEAKKLKKSHYLKVPLETIIPSTT